MTACERGCGSVCGCCGGIAVETPEAIDNRPALTALAYRVGRYATFNASLLASLSSAQYAPMALLRTRDPSDFSIALLDAWAVTLDVLTFYQERFVNEAYLRTAVDPRSVFELARLVGYVPSPGVAASVVLVFTLSTTPGSPDSVTIPAGSRVQSVPGPGQTPQLFETSVALAAIREWNALPARTMTPWLLAEGTTSAWFQGTATKVNVGDVLLFVQATNGTPIARGHGDVHYVTAVEVAAAANATKITWDSGLSSVFGAGLGQGAACVFVFRKKAALFGAQAPDPSRLPWWVVDKGPGKPAARGDDWTFYHATGTQVNLDASYPGLKPPANGTSQWAVLAGSKGTSFFLVTDAGESSPLLYTLSAKTTYLELAFGEVLSTEVSGTIDTVLSAYVADTRNVTAYVQTDPLTPVDSPTSWNANPGYALAPDMPAPVAGTCVTVRGGQGIGPGGPIGVTGRRVRLTVQPSAGATFTPAQTTASMSVADGQTFLVDAYPPAAASGGLAPAWSVITLSGSSGTLYVRDTYVLLGPSDKADPATGEAALASTVEPGGDSTMLGLKAALARIYDAATVAINANAVDATHGETVQEILGSGDATNAALQFTLKQSPLTYVASPSAIGATSTLQVWVNNLQWHEVPNLLSSGPADRSFLSRASAAGSVTARFGNGVQGALTPTGQSNIRAVYRKGIGSAGMVAVGQLTQAIDRPQGLSSVTNPSAASGAADPASADDARSSAPLPALTLGRVVSLEDYQNFALNFAGVTRALATWTRFRGTRGVFLTVAGANGSTPSASDSIVSDLTLSLTNSGNPFLPVQVASYQPILFEVGASITIDQTDYDPDQVLAQVWQNLAAAFSFATRQLGQNVAASEIVEAIQNTPGVIALQLQTFGVSGTPTATVPSILCASGPTPPQGAQMLLIDSASQANLKVAS
ncbi:MAG TPA: putative baseplate assembly protein [Polyangiaceae bacterium]|jgi:hypothetical protein|nr:putative baseplate assembly protein [Polyangiaceae bacterium]